MLIHKGNLKGFDVRLVVRGFWGTSAFEGRSLSYTGKRALDAAKRAGGILGLQQYGWKQNTEGDEAPQVALGPTFTLSAREVNHEQNAYTGTNLSPLKVAPNPLQTGKALLWTSSGAMDLTTSRTFGAAQPFFVRAALPDILESQTYQIWAANWGNHDPFAFRLEFRLFGKSGRQVWIHRLLPAWTPTLQNQMNALLVQQKSETPPDGIEAQIETRARQIYAQSEDITSEAGLGKIGEIDFGEYLIIPQNRQGAEFPGKLLVIGQKKEAWIDLIPHASELTSDGIKRLAQFPSWQLWGAGKIALSCNGGISIWQLDTPSFDKTPKLKLPGTYGGATSFNGQWMLAPGTNIQFALDATEQLGENGEQYYAPEIRFFSDGNYAPFLYGVVGFEPPSPRQFSSAVEFDSDDYKVFGAARFENCTLTCEGKNQPTRATLTMLAGDGGLVISDGFGQPLFHNRMASLSIEGQTVLGNALIIRSEAENLHRITKSEGFSSLVGPNTKIHFRLACLWQRAEEVRLQYDLVLDGLRLGAAIRRLLEALGCTPGEMAGVPANYGTMVDTARVGQSFSEVCAKGSTIAANLRRLMEDYAPDDELTPRSGVWTITPPSSQVVARFCEKPRPGQTPPEFPILKPIAFIRDFVDFANRRELSGGKDLAGNAVGAVYADYGSAKNDRARNHIGRWKDGEPIRDERRRDAGSARRAVRAAARRENQGGCAYNFGTDQIFGLWPGARVWVEDNETQGDVLCELASLGDGSAQRGKSVMEIMAVEVMSQ